MLTHANLNERCYPVVNEKDPGGGDSNTRFKPAALDTAVSTVRGFPPLAQPCALRGEADGERDRGCDR